jgi:hypothetical protein
MSSFQLDIDKVSTDPTIQNYFSSNGIDFHLFVLKYIQIDQLLQSHHSGNDSSTSNNSFTQQLFTLHQCIQQQQQLISGLSTQLKDTIGIEFQRTINEYLQHSLNQSQTTGTSVKESLEAFQQRLLNVNTEKLNEMDRKNLNMMSVFQSNILKDISTTLDSHTMHHKITSINDTLTQLHNNFTGNSSQKGKMTENILFTNLLQAFPDSDVVLTRDQSDSCDIQIKRDGLPTILIDSKHCEASNVRKSDLEKFYEDCQINDSCGILCNAFGGIANRKHFEIDIKDKRVFVFLSNHQFDPILFQVASRIIYNIQEIVRDQRTDIIQIDQQLYQRLKIEYNFFLQSFQQHLDNIKQNVNALSQLTLTQLDHFFKRTALTTQQAKAFACHLCGTGCNTTKALKKHLKDKHDFVMAASKKGRPSKNENSDNEAEAGNGMSE